MEITVYGYILIPLLILLFFLDSRYLVYMLIIALTLQVTSLFNIKPLSNYSMQIYRFITILISLKFIGYMIDKKFSLRFREKKLKKLFVYGVLFSCFATLLSFLAPFIFMGYPVYPPQLGIDYSAIYGASSLHFSIYNIAFPVYIWFYVLTLAYISTMKWSYRDLIAVKKIVFICLIIVTLTSSSQLIWIFIPGIDITKYIYTITIRKLNYQLIPFLNIVRIQATYEEPSMLSPFITGIYAYYLYYSIIKPGYINFFLALLALFITLLSSSSTAYVSLAVITLLIIFYLKPLKVKKFNIYIRKNVILYSVFLLLVIGLFIMLLVFFVIGTKDLIHMINFTLLKKAESSSFKDRTTADLHALKLFLKTYGLGVGLGSNRPSSLMPYLLSQLGIIGTSLFAIFIVKILHFSYNSLKNTDSFGFFFPLLSVLISQLIAYPDITNPTLWQFIYIAIIVSLGIKKELKNVNTKRYA